MGDYYVRVSFNRRPYTVARYANRAQAGYVADQLGGERISKTALQRQEGLTAVRQAEDDLLCPSPTFAPHTLRLAAEWADKQRSGRAINITGVPQALRSAAVEAAEAEGISANEWYVRAIEKELAGDVD